MKNLLLFILSFTLTLPLYSQTVIHGRVTEPNGSPVPFATVYIQNTITGALTDTLGHYKLNTKLKGDLVIVAVAIGYDTMRNTLTVADAKEYTLNITLKGNSQVLNEVDITPGAFEANNDRKVAMLTTLDIYTTASAQGDIVGAIQTLPGAQKVSDQTGLFVRGGDATESEAIVDGLVMQDPFFSPVPGVAQRSRFGPYQFKGISFSSGGYSARYGQALSGILELNTNDMPEETTYNLNVSMAGVGISADKRWAHSSIEGGFNYTNTTPFFALAKPNLDFFSPPIGYGGFLRYVWTNKNNDILKLAYTMSTNTSGIDVIDPNQPDTTLAFKLKNYYMQGSLYYKHFFTTKTFVTVATSYSQNGDTVLWGGYNFDKQDYREESRVEVASEFSDKLYGYMGTEVSAYGEKQRYDSITFPFDEVVAAGYAEAEWRPAKWFGLKPGVRYEYSQILAKGNVAPRISAAIRLNKYGQISFAYGTFYQDPSDKYLLYGSRAGFQQATHYIANYEFIHNDRTFRVEGYYKDYNHLIQEVIPEGIPYDPNPYRPYFWPTDLNGHGYAQGIDVFWRDKKSIKNFDYWISYSYIDTKRLYMNFPTEAMPDYVSNNNLNIVTKYFIEKPGINISLTYNLASGRPYYNPENPVFLGDRTPAYQDLSLSFSFLFTVKKLFGVFYVGIDNITNNPNILGYNYSDNGLQRFPIVPALYRSAFAGLFLSLTPFKKDEL